MSRSSLRDAYNRHTRQRSGAAQGTNVGASGPSDIAIGRLYVSLMLAANEASGMNDLSQIQFNFCLQNENGEPLPTRREDIQRCILTYLGSVDSGLNAEDKKIIEANLREIAPSLPEETASLHNYKETLSLRAKSYHAAAMNLLQHRGGDAAQLETDKEMLSDLKYKFDQLMNEDGGPEMQQARFSAYMDALTDKLGSALNMDVDAVKKELKEAETIQNIKQNKAQVTFSGTVETRSGIPKSKNIHVQIEQPCNRFSDFSKSQQEEWKKVYAEYKGGKSNPDFPKWFQKRTDLEKKIWLEKMEQVMAGNSNVNMGPVVNKKGLPGLRNLALTSFATFELKGMGPPEIKMISAKSVRSSNLISQAKDGNFKLNDDQKKLTQQNIEQISEIYKNNNMANKAGGFEYNDKQRQPYVLCQTLVRIIGGGDDHVIRNKNAAIKAINKKNGNDMVFGSNHCIGTPAKISTAFHFVMHAAGANTKGMRHIDKPVTDFIDNAVIKSVDNKVSQQYLRDFRDAALKGRVLNPKEVATVASKCGFSVDQAKTLDRVLQATSMYANETRGLSSFKKTHQLHMAALEEIIYQDTGNCVQSSCKSGKDRKGVQINYRNAMLAFYAEYGRLPPSSSKREMVKGDREKFVEIFVELFKTHHQARLAELNAMGCQGQKALNNILPKDIQKALKQDGGVLLKAHKERSALADLGHSAVEADQNELNKSAEKFQSQANVERPHLS
jgi:hypothetical protein